MQPTSPRARVPLNRDAALSEARSQIDAIYNTSSQATTAKSSIQPITSTPSIKPREHATTRDASTVSAGSSATFTLPQSSARQSHRPIVRRSISDIHRPTRPSQTTPQRSATAMPQHDTPLHRSYTQASTKPTPVSASSTSTSPVSRIVKSPSSPRVAQEQPKPTSSAHQRTEPAFNSSRPHSPRAEQNQAEPKTAFSSAPAQPEHASQPGAPRQPSESQKAAWQQYHSAWQNYYQQYYERYYLGQVKKAKDELAQANQASASSNDTPPAAPSATDTDTDKDKDNDIISKEEALDDLRSGLLDKLQTTAKNVRQSRHFVPALAALTVMVVFLFLQYNRVIFSYVAAWTTPSTLDAQNYIISPYDTNNVGPDPKLIIPKIAVDVPIIWDANAASQASLNAAMDKGVVWFNIPGANAKPGEVGNFVLSGHSSNDWLDNGKYKFIFARLEQMQKGDNIYVNYNGTRYTYTVTGSRVVKPTDVQALQTNATKPTMTLITCVPLGTALNRLLVTAEQVSPDPSSANKKSSSDTSSQKPASNSATMPGNSPSFIQRVGNLFSGGNNH